MGDTLRTRMSVNIERNRFRQINLGIQSKGIGYPLPLVYSGRTKGVRTTAESGSRLSDLSAVNPSVDNHPRCINHQICRESVTATRHQFLFLVNSS